MSELRRQLQGDTPVALVHYEKFFHAAGALEGSGVDIAPKAAHVKKHVAGVEVVVKQAQYFKARIRSSGCPVDHSDVGILRWKPNQLRFANNIDPQPRRFDVDIREERARGTVIDRRNVRIFQRVIVGQDGTELVDGGARRGR